MTIMIVDEEVMSSKHAPDDDTIEHYYCSCSPNVSLCGLDVSDANDHTDMDTPLEDDCVVCVDFLETPCERCGRTDG